jgi:hypothetical protein
MPQVDTWSALKNRGDFVIERRFGVDGSERGVWLCMMEQREKQIKLPEEMVVAIEGRLKISESKGWES